MDETNDHDKKINEEASGYVSEILQQAGSKPTSTPLSETKRNFVPLFIVLFFISVALTAWNLAGLASDYDVVTPQEELTYARFLIFTAIQEVNFYRDSAGALPTDLTFADSEDEDLAYSVNGSAFWIGYSGGDINLEYRDGDPLAPFASAFETVTGTTVR
ncbi:MAG: hypothetical protein OEZ54_02775 [Gemmatimonadota bacterium]|nr:hypothetical protein [Gemmatimonadota bacterium]